MLANRKLLFSFLLSILIVGVLAGCGLAFQRNAPGSKEQPLFVPPTISPSLTPTATPTLSRYPQQPQNPIADEDEVVEAEPIDCEDNLEFVDDITIPDGTVVEPGSSLDKQWEVKNAGNCNWTSEYSLRLISGVDMGTDGEQDLVPARTSSNVTIQIQFTAPEEPGNYKSAWQAFTPEGVPFGVPIYIDINVE